jgi:hypothetical protein
MKLHFFLAEGLGRDLDHVVRSPQALHNFTSLLFVVLDDDRIFRIDV